MIDGMHILTAILLERGQHECRRCSARYAGFDDDVRLRGPHGCAQGLSIELAHRGAYAVESWVAALHAPATHGAPADLDVELPHTWRHHSHVFLILHRHSRRGDRAGTVWTRHWHRHRDDVVAARGCWPMPMAAMAQSGAAPAAPRRRRALREGRRLACARPASHVELVLQSLVCAAKPVALALQPVTLVFQPGTLPFRPLQVPP